MSSPFTTVSDKISSDVIAKYLREHPDFFLNQPDLLTELTLPHESGPAVSLVEKQVAILRERNMEMRQRLSRLLDNAKQNDALFDKTKRLVLSLLESKDLASVVEALYDSFNKDFGIHFTRLILFGSNGLNAGPARIESISKAKLAIGDRLRAIRTVSGGINLSEYEFLFDDDASHIGSAALTILSHGNIIGVLAIGNQDPNHYHSSMGTLFLGYIGEVLNRILPRHL